MNASAELHCCNFLSHPCTQVELANVRSFYTEAQKSPFKALPWKNGTMHFHYVPQVPCRCCTTAA